MYKPYKTLCGDNFDKSEYDMFIEHVLEPKLNEIKQMFLKKALEYSEQNDLFHNFYNGATMDNISPTRCLWDYMRKHLVSIQDIVNNPKRFDIETIQEKTSDVILYLILLEGIIRRDLAVPKSLKNV